MSRRLVHFFSSFFLAGVVVVAFHIGAAENASSARRRGLHVFTWLDLISPLSAGMNLQTSRQINVKKFTACVLCSITIHSIVYIVEQKLY